LGFFGLTPEDKPKLHEQIFQLMYYGEGFNHSDLYEMPVYLRNFYYQKLLDTRKKENEEVKKSNQKIKSSNSRFKR
jgi:hypothetical protein